MFSSSKRGRSSIRFPTFLLRVISLACAAAGTECGTRTRLEGFTTDLGRIIHINGVHIDPLTGAATDSFPWNFTEAANGGGGGGGGFVAVPDTDPLPPVGAQPGRWRFRPSNRVFAPYGADITHAEVTATVHASLVCPQAPLTHHSGMCRL